MNSFIKKDLLMIKNNNKTLFLTIILYIVYTFMFDTNMIIFLPVMGLLFCISTISYDEYNNFYTYAAALPMGRKNIVKSKYIVTIFILIVTFIIGILLNYLFLIVNSKIQIGNFASLASSMFALSLMISFIYPFMFKFGAEKGRLFMIGFAILVYGIFTLLLKNISIPLKIMTFFNKYYIILFIIAGFILLFVSYTISKKIIEKKEF